MTRRVWRWMVVGLLVAEAAVWALGNRVVNRVEAGGVTLVFDEGFEGPGYENAWTETDPNGILNDQSTAQVHAGTYALFIDGSGNSGEPDDWTAYDNTSSFASTVYGRVMVYIPTGSTVNDYIRLGHCNDNSVLNGSGAAWFEVGLLGGNCRISATAHGASPITADFTLDAWHRLEWKYDATAGTLDWRVDGVDQTQLTGGSTGRGTRYLYVGTTQLAQGYIDEYAVSEEGWIGAP